VAPGAGIGILYLPFVMIALVWAGTLNCMCRKPSRLREIVATVFICLWAAINVLRVACVLHAMSAAYLFSCKLHYCSEGGFFRYTEPAWNIHLSEPSTSWGRVKADISWSHGDDGRNLSARVCSHSVWQLRIRCKCDLECHFRPIQEKITSG